MKKAHSKWKIHQIIQFRIPVVPFIILYKVVLTFESVNKILMCDHSNESYWAVFSCGAVYYVAQGGANFWDCGWNPNVWPSKWKLHVVRNTFLWCCLWWALYKVQYLYIPLYDLSNCTISSSPTEMSLRASKQTPLDELYATMFCPFSDDALWRRLSQLHLSFSFLCA